MPITAASNEPIRIASLASASNGVPAKARPLMNSAIVKPMPPRQAVPHECRQRRPPAAPPARTRPRASRRGRCRAACRRPARAMMPSGTDDGQAARARRASIATPALKSPKTGRMAKATHGLHRVLERCSGAVAASSDAPSASMPAMRSGSIASGWSSRSDLDAARLGRITVGKRLGAMRAGRDEQRRAARRPSWRGARLEERRARAPKPSSSVDGARGARRSGWPTSSAARSRRRGDAERHSERCAGVEERDDEHRAEVVDDRQRDQEDLQAVGHARAEQGQHAEREGDVGRHRDAPAGAPAPPALNAA